MQSLLPKGFLTATPFRETMRQFLPCRFGLLITPTLPVAAFDVGTGRAARPFEDQEHRVLVKFHLSVSI